MLGISLLVLCRPSGALGIRSTITGALRHPARVVSARWPGHRIHFETPTMRALRRHLRSKRRSPSFVLPLRGFGDSFDGYRGLTAPGKGCIGPLGNDVAEVEA